jgi:signal transduction histidine kinase
MLAYSGRGKFVLGRMDLSELVRETVALVHSSIPRSVTVDLHVSDQLPPINADLAQIQQLVMNLDHQRG